MADIIFPTRQKSKCRVCCAVGDCHSKASKHLNIMFHKFPKPGERFVAIENFFGNLESIDKLEAWKNLLKINVVTPQMKVCSLHFKKSDYILPDYNSGRKFLKKTAVPSYNLPKCFAATNNIKTETRLQRRLKRNNSKKITIEEYILPDPLSVEMESVEDRTIEEYILPDSLPIEMESVKKTPVSKIHEAVAGTSKDFENSQSAGSFDITSSSVAN